MCAYILSLKSMDGTVANLSPSSCLYTFLPVFYVSHYFSTFRTLVFTHEDVCLSI